MVFGGLEIWERSTYMASNRGKPNPLPQRSVHSDVDQLVASCNFDPWLDYPWELPMSTHSSREEFHILNLGSSWKIGSEGRGLFPIYRFIGSPFNFLMICCIVPPFNKRKPLNPLVLLFWGKATQVRLQEFISFLCFPICLWMVGKTHFQLSPLKFE